jgi:hypothetical protein
MDVFSVIGAILAAVSLYRQEKGREPCAETALFRALDQLIDQLMLCKTLHHEFHMLTQQVLPQVISETRDVRNVEVFAKSWNRVESHFAAQNLPHLLKRIEAATQATGPWAPPAKFRIPKLAREAIEQVVDIFPRLQEMASAILSDYSLISDSTKARNLPEEVTQILTRLQGSCSLAITHADLMIRESTVILAWVYDEAFGTTT